MGRNFVASSSAARRKIASRSWIGVAAHEACAAERGVDGAPDVVGGRLGHLGQHLLVRVRRAHLGRARSLAPLATDEERDVDGRLAHGLERALERLLLGRAGAVAAGPARCAAPGPSGWNSAWRQDKVIFRRTQWLAPTTDDSTKCRTATRSRLSFEGDDVPACAGESVAVALFASGERVLSRSIKYHRPRGFFCLAGHCGACLMRIDGKPNVRACKTPVKEGMRVERQNAFPTGAFDVLGAADFFFPKGMDHHTMMTSPRALNAVLNKVVRQLGGLGKLPETTAAPAELPRPRHKPRRRGGGRRRTGRARLRHRVRARRQAHPARRRAGPRRRLAPGASALRRARGQRGAGGGAQGRRRGALVVDGAGVVSRGRGRAPAASRACSPCTRPTGSAR